MTRLFKYLLVLIPVVSPCSGFSQVSPTSHEVRGTLQGQTLYASYMIGLSTGQILGSGNDQFTVPIDVHGY